MMPSVTVIIPFKHVSDLLIEAVKSCQNLDYPKSCLELILVQNGKEENISLSGIENNATIKLLQTGEGNAYLARNAGAKASSGDILLFTDSDCIVSCDWAGRLVDALSSSRAPAVVGCVKAYQPKSALEFFGDEYVFNHKFKDFDYLMGGNCGITKAVFNEIGGFDEGFTSGGDIDISIRLKKRGYEIKYVPEAIVYHKHRNTLKGLFCQYRKYGAGWRVLKNKWGGSLGMYSVSKRLIVAPVFLLIGLFNILAYLFKIKSPKAKANYFRFLYLAIVNIALVVGFMSFTVKGNKCLEKA